MNIREIKLHSNSLKIGLVNKCSKGPIKLIQCFFINTFVFCAWFHLMPYFGDLFYYTFNLNI